ncbi:MAG: LacI family DNA-binding transcriptional regulator, partial [Fibrella sp.]|nr:LacI family DNA-binding transcriptional regulator [Armatimonadota bacterium]
MMRKNTNPTLQDVARIAGVSPYTVSSVLNGSRSNTRVSPATRVRIEEAARTLSYHPNATARSLVTRTTRIIGVLIPFVLSSAEAFSDDYASAILAGITEQAAADGYDILHYTQIWRDDAASVARFRDRRTDGVLVVAPLTGSDVIEALSALDIPVVAVSALPLPYTATAPTGIGFVDVDNAAGIRLAVEYLLHLGHTRIAHLSGEWNSASAVQRRSAWESVLGEHGVSAPSD